MMKKTTLTLFCALAIGACSAGNDSVSAEGREWIDLGQTPSVSHLFEEPVFDLEDDDAPIEVFESGAYLDHEDGHEYFVPSLEEDLAQSIREQMPEWRGELDEELALDNDHGVALDEQSETFERVLGSDGRTRVTNRSAEPFSSIGRYSLSLTGAANCNGLPSCNLTCTGTLVGSRYVAISAHCIYDRGDNAWINSNVAGANLRGQMCFNTTGGTQCRNVTSRKISPTWRNSGINRAQHDYALLRLSSAPGSAPVMRMSSLSSSSSIRSKSARQHGYPGTTPTGATSGLSQLFGMSCSVTDVTSRRLSHNCDTTGGHSGGPLYYRLASGRPFLLGIHSGSATFQNTAARVAGSATRTWLVDEMAGW